MHVRDPNENTRRRCVQATLSSLPPPTVPRSLPVDHNAPCRFQPTNPPSSRIGSSSVATRHKNTASIAVPGFGGANRLAACRWGPASARCGRRHARRSRSRDCQSCRRARRVLRMTMSLPATPPTSRATAELVSQCVGRCGCATPRAHRTRMRRDAPKRVRTSAKLVPDTRPVPQCEARAQPRIPPRRHCPL